jgi:hypothetical protein
MVSLDASFGNSGKVITSLNLGESGWDLAIDANGNIFVAGSAYKAPVQEVSQKMWLLATISPYRLTVKFW